MKKILVLLFLVVSFSNIYGQKPNNSEEKIYYFVKSAVKEYTLNLNQYKKLLRARRKYIKDYMNTTKDFKNGGLSKDQKKAKIQAVNRGFNESFTKITGVLQRELEPFLVRMRKEISKI
ncbi:hypothetical protein A8C32_07615 [Flavivirga aquatica]|uniref:Uncharacterized protein n=1 Tax=Flavivirga aquatica TaxID=1849968 RepID=A0A1E5SIU7_9FLAO|nr:hypothetical protein [Flavivirga aquatica]OEJ99035.1 hypothetical protein A8C32_07615 [Flavivirga aquatica]